MTEPVDRTDDKTPAKPAPSNALKWAVAIVAGLALAVVLVVGMNMSATTYTVNDEGDVLADGETIVPGEPSAAPEGSTGSGDPAFDYAVKKLASMRQESAERLRDLGMSVDVPESQSDDTPNEELLGKYYADLYSILKVGETDTAEANRLLPGLMNPDNTDDYTRLRDQVIGRAMADSLADDPFREVIDWSDNFYTAMIENVEPNGEATRFFIAMKADTSANEFTYQRHSGEWILQKQLPLEDPQAIKSTKDFNESIPPR